MDAANLMMVEGALIGALVVLRMACVPFADLDGLPKSITHRIEIGDRLAPWFGAIALALIVIGCALRVGGG
ncbi:MAG: hypothetical protein L0H24_14735 [Microlunatus sp.]|nr:hypothetical protein [Microlunatus sp.]